MLEAGRPGGGDPQAAEAAARALDRARLRREREHLRRLRINEAGVALAALALSATALGINFFNYSRGSEVVALQPEQIVLYRTDGASDSSLWLAVPLQLVNASRDYGDVVVSASATVNPEDRGSTRFNYVNLVEPVMSKDVDRALEECPQGARCLPATGFYVIERPKRLLDVPGGSSRSEFLAFQLESFNCRPEGDGCRSFANFDSALASFRRDGGLAVEIDIALQFDGEKRIRCALSPDPQRRAVILDYLAEKGWAQPECVTT